MCTFLIGGMPRKLSASWLSLYSADLGRRMDAFLIDLGIVDTGGGLDKVHEEL